MAEPTPARHLLREIDDILVKRPGLGVLVDQVEEFRRAVTAGPTGPIGASPLTSAELRLLPYLQTHLTLGVIAERLFVSRNTVSSQVTSIHRKLDASSRREAVEKATSAGLARRLAVVKPGSCYSGSSTSNPSASANLGAASTTPGRPRTGTRPNSTPTISLPVAPAAHAASACSP